MFHTIENEFLTCKIEATGAEVRSLIEKSTGKEFIWQINPAVWGSSSPVLFPAIGNIKDGIITHNGKTYAMTKHGIIRNNDNLEFEQLSKAKCSFTLTSSQQTKRKYPFDFKFSVNYELVENRLILTYEIENKDKAVMYFSCGGHTAYNLPIDTDTGLSDYAIEFPDNKSSLVAETLGDSGLLSYHQRHYKLKDHCLELSNSIFNEDALIFADIDFDWVRLRHKNDSKGILVRFKGYPHLALWSKSQANYVCIEPWLGLPDREDEPLELSEKKTYQKLEPQKTFSISIETLVE